MFLFEENPPVLPVAADNPAPLLVPADTTVEAARVQLRVLRNMTPAQRLQMGFDLSAAVRRRLDQGVRMRHPEYDDETVRKAVLLLMHGPAVFNEVFPGCTVQP